MAVESPDPQAASPGRTGLEVVPNPARGRVCLLATAPGPAGVSIYSQSGDLVRALALPGAGRQLLVWDGKDGAGHPAPAGVYFARLCFRGGTAGARLVLLGP